MIINKGSLYRYVLSVQYTLETFTEVRSTAWEQEPYTGTTIYNSLSNVTDDSTFLMLVISSNSSSSSSDASSSDVVVVVVLFLFIFENSCIILQKMFPKTHM